MTKTPILTGAEVCVTDLGGQNASVQNLSGDTIWASAYPGVTAGADDVYEIPAGGGVVVLDARGTVYLLGTGKVQCTGTNYATPNFRQPSSSNGGGGGTSDVTKAYVDAQDSTTLGVAKTYTDTAVNAVKTDVTANADDIADLQTNMTAAQSAITANSAAVATAQTAAADAQATADTAKSTAEAAQTAANSAQEAADTNAANITATAAATLESANTYTDTKTSALDTRVAATETAITTLNGTGTGSVTKAVADGIAEVVAGAPESFDTLKEISDWISSHSDSAAAMNTQIQTNSTDISALQTAKADKTEIPTTLPANGGNADTVNGHTVNADVPENAVFTDTVYSLPAATKTALGGVKVGDNLSVAADGTLSAPIYSNPNLLDNPDFKINQRGVSGTITAAGYFVDRWKLKSGSVTVNDNKTLTLNGTIEQILENTAGANVTASSNAGSISYNNSTKTVSLTGQNVTVSWVKLELGNKATPFVPPSPAEELMKCMYYYEKGGQSVNRVTTNFNLFCSLMFALPKRVAPTVKLIALYHNGVDATSSYFNDISTVNVALSNLDTRHMRTNGIPASKGTITENDFTYVMQFEASADL